MQRVVVFDIGKMRIVGGVVEIDGELKRLCVEGPVLCFS